jgi:hypothetical protein
MKGKTKGREHAGGSISLIASNDNQSSVELQHNLRKLLNKFKEQEQK